MSLLLIPGILCVAALVLTVAVLRRRQRELIPPALRPPTIRQPGPFGTSPSSSRERPAPARRRASPGEQDSAAPPDPAQAWTAQVEWRDAGRHPRFCVVGHDENGAAEVVLAESPPLEWPPVGAEAVQALTDAARGLESSLLGAGWTALPSGTAWYAKRFRWQPSAAGADASSRPGRFGRAPWPEGSEDYWRCEVELNANPSLWRFHVAVLDP